MYTSRITSFSSPPRDLLQEHLPILIQLLLPHSVDLEQPIGRARLLRRHGLERAVAEYYIGGHFSLIREPLAKRAQTLEQLGAGRRDTAAVVRHVGVDPAISLSGAPCPAAVRPARRDSPEPVPAPTPVPVPVPGARAPRASSTTSRSRAIPARFPARRHVLREMARKTAPQARAHVRQIEHAAHRTALLIRHLRVRGVGIIDQPIERNHVGPRVEQHAIGGRPVAARAPDLLVVPLDRAGHVAVEHVAHVLFVESPCRRR